MFDLFTARYFKNSGYSKGNALHAAIEIVQKQSDIGKEIFNSIPQENGRPESY